jgi:hypothetical protein
MKKLSNEPKPLQKELNSEIEKKTTGRSAEELQQMRDTVSSKNRKSEQVNASFLLRARARKK